MTEEDRSSLLWHLRDGRIPSDWYRWREHNEEINREYPGLVYADSMITRGQDLVRAYAALIFEDY